LKFRIGNNYLNSSPTTTNRLQQHQQNNWVQGRSQGLYPFQDQLQHQQQQQQVEQKQLQHPLLSQVDGKYSSSNDSRGWIHGPSPSLAIHTPVSLVPSHDPSKKMMLNVCHCLYFLGLLISLFLLCEYFITRRFIDLPGSITRDDIANKSIDTSKLDTNSITSTKIAPGNISSYHLNASSVQTSHLAAGSVTTNIIGFGQLRSMHFIANSIHALILVDNSISEKKLQSGSIKARHLSSASILSDHIGGAVITNRHYAPKSITNSKLADNSITSRNLYSSSISEHHIRTGAILNRHLGDGIILGNKIADNQIDNRHLKRDRLTGDVFQSSTIDSSKIKDLHGSKILPGSIPSSALETSLRSTYLAGNLDFIAIYESYGLAGWNDFTQTPITYNFYLHHGSINCLNTDTIPSMRDPLYNVTLWSFDKLDLAFKRNVSTYTGSPHVLTFKLSDESASIFEFDLLLNSAGHFTLKSMNIPTRLQPCFSNDVIFTRSINVIQNQMILQTKKTGGLWFVISTSQNS
jgi:hypothetical protein